MLVAGLPGAGKTTLIDRAAPTPRWAVVDTDRLRRRLPGRLARTPFLRVAYLVATGIALVRHERVVIHSRGTSPLLRRLLTTAARRRRAHAVLLLLDTPPLTALAGQNQRGRIVSGRVMRRESRRWSELRSAVREHGLAHERWSRIVVLNRSEAAALRELDDLLPLP